MLARPVVPLQPLPTIDGKVPYDVALAIKQSYEVLGFVASCLSSWPEPITPLTMDQIRKSLGATGATPLNVFELVGGSTAGKVTIGTHDERLAAVNPSTGGLFWETDRTALYLYTATGWVLISNQPFTGTLTPNEKPDDLVEGDNGFVFNSTDFNRLFVWDGTALDWVDAPGQDQRGVVVFVDFSLNTSFEPGPGWVLLDGGTYDVSQPDGTVVSETVRDMTTDNRYARSVAGATGGTIGDALNHTHDVQVLDNVSRTVAAVGDNTASNQLLTTTGPSGTGGEDALPPSTNLRPYMRV